MVVSVGVDAGSTVLKVVGISSRGEIEFAVSEPTDPRMEEQVRTVLEKAATEHAFGLSDVVVVATGYGSKLVSRARRKITEITCHAKGIFGFMGHGGTLLDVGGQDSKVIIVDDEGKVVDFVMNDKCAAGTGRFLENSAWRLRIPMEEMGNVALSTEEEVSISSTCAVFAESEVISRLARGERLEPVIRGLHRSLVKRVVAMIGIIGLRPPLMLSGGVVLNRAIQEMLREEIGELPQLPKHPQFVGAYGAALLGLPLI